MRNNEEKRKWIWITGVIFLGGFLMYLFVPTYITLARYREERAALDMRNKALEEENENLKMDISKLKNDPLYIEQIARKELGMIRQGEIIYRISPTEETQEDTGRTATKTKGKKE